MADLSIVYMRSCITNRDWKCEVEGSKETYTVSFGIAFSGKYRYDYSCTCPSFKFRKQCKHIKAVEANRCGWDEFTDGGEATKDNKCPECGAETFVIRHGV